MNAGAADGDLLACSPLAGGNLGGKYLGGAVPAGSRRDMARQSVRYDLPGQAPASACYVAIAQAHGIDSSQFAMAFVNSRPFVTSTIIGATSIAQFRTNIASLDVNLPVEAIAGIEAVHREIPDLRP